MIILIAFGIIFAVVFLQRLVYIKLAFKNLSVSCLFSRAEVNEGEIFYITEIIENKKYLPLPAVSTILQVGDGLAFADEGAQVIEQKSVFCFYTMGPYKKITRTWRVKATRRGRFNISELTINLRDIFGLVRLSESFACEASVLVLPAGYAADRRVAAREFTGGERAVRHGYYTDPFDVQKILKYTGEPLNRINWKASARSQELMVNAEQPAVAERALVILDASDKQYLERNIKICATLPAMLPDENEVTLVSNGRLPEDCANPLIKRRGEFIETGGFNVRVHERDFKRLLSELGGDFDEFYNIAGSGYALSHHLRQQRLTAEKLAQAVQKNIRGRPVLLVKGGRIYDCESGQAILI